jgi:hypothetical protein
MTMIHIEHRVPLAFPLLLLVCVTPWGLACLIESSLPVLAVGVVSLGYSGALLATLWPIHDELTDALPHGVGCILGTVAIMGNYFRHI